MERIWRQQKQSVHTDGQTDGRTEEETTDKAIPKWCFPPWGPWGIIRE